MTETTDFISRLVRAANHVTTLHHLEAKRLLDRAIGHIEELRAESGIVPMPGRDAVIYMRTVAAGVDRVSREEWHHALLHAAEIPRSSIGTRQRDRDNEYDEKPVIQVSVTEKPKDFLLYTDGSHDPVSQRGGWGFVVYHAGNQVAAECGSITGGDNSGAELAAVHAALDWIAKKGQPPFHDPIF